MIYFIYYYENVWRFSIELLPLHDLSIIFIFRCNQGVGFPINVGSGLVKGNPFSDLYVTIRPCFRWIGRKLSFKILPSESKSSRNLEN